MTRRSPWGSVRRLPSGRFQARYRVGSVDHLAPQTFSTARQAHAFLATTRSAIERLDLAESALHAPAATVGDAEFDPDLATKAAVLCARIVKNHPLLDGNKRVGEGGSNAVLEARDGRFPFACATVEIAVLDVLAVKAAPNQVKKLREQAEDQRAVVAFDSLSELLDERVDLDAGHVIACLPDQGRVKAELTEECRHVVLDR